MDKFHKAEALRLPATVVQRIIKDALPANAAVSKEARTAIGRAASLFILNMMTVSSDFAVSRKRKQITAEDVYQGVKVAELEHLVEPLKEAVDLWKIVKAQKSEEAKKRKLDKASAASMVEDNEEDEEGEEAIVDKQKANEEGEHIETPAEDDEDDEHVEEEEDVADDASQSTESSQDEGVDVDPTPSPSGTDEIRDIEDF